MAVDPYLLDTHALVWALDQPELLSAMAAAAIAGGGAIVSAASLWELLIKKDKPASPVKDPVTWWQRHITDAGVAVIPIHASHIRLLDSLPPYHRDPFDRILICQAMHQRLSLVTNDKTMRLYGETVNIVW